MIKLTPEQAVEWVEWLASYTTPEGDGVTRLLYSKEWREAQKGLQAKLEEIGFEVEYDAVGNMAATLRGSEEPDSIIATGSHIDTVVQGGKYDGQLGILCGLMAMKELVEEHGQPKKSMRLIAFAEEEGSRFPYAFWGSHNIVGMQNEELVRNADDGGVFGEPVKFVDAMHACGFDFNTSGELPFKEMDAWIELHAEQGLTLQLTGDQIGIVNAIVGQKRYTVTLTGEANHAGTTLMGYRRDAIEGFAQIVTKALARVKEIGDPLVCTFGRVDVTPNTVNVVPGKVVFSMDTRHPDQKALDVWSEELENIVKDVAAELNLEADIDMWMNEAPVPMNQEIVDLLESVCKDAGLTYRVMHSGAGHDTQIIAPHVPSAMIFIPSKDGISHNPSEYSKPEEIVDGTQVLAEAFYRLAY